MLRIMVWWMVWVLVAGAAVRDRQIANMFILGFDGKKLTPKSPIVRDVCERGLGGVILFGKNIVSPSQVRALTAQLRQCAHRPLIAVDQEGGKVRRIRFGQEYARAAQVGQMGPRAAEKVYDRMARELSALGINYNLAPVADLDIQSRNYIIHKLGRSYGSDPKQVIAYNRVFIQAMRRHRILTALKHFPGHGSSLGDTHNGFVDVTHDWREIELKPFGNTAADSVMVAHVFNRRIDTNYPASLSQRTIGLLRGKLGFGGVVITDDLQMGAIRKHYSLEQTVALAVNAGNDLLLFGNQLTKKKKVTTAQLVGIVRKLLREGRIDEQSILQANRRIARMRERIALRDRPRISRPAVQKKQPAKRTVKRQRGGKVSRPKTTSRTPDMF